MISKKNVKREFKKLCSSFLEQRKLFNIFAKKSSEQIDVIKQISYHIQCETNQYEGKLLEIERDTNIHLSRLSYLEKKLKDCDDTFDKILTSNITVDIYNECLECFLLFYKKEREVCKQFFHFQKKWIYEQELILSKV